MNNNFDVKILGIDYGRAKIGLALGENFLAEPHKVIKYKSFDILFKQIDEIARKEGVVRIVVGVSESKMAKESQDFGERLNESLNIPVDFQDETLSSQDAGRLAIEAGISRKKRKGLEDAYAAAILLQNYLDTQST